MTLRIIAHRGASSLAPENTLPAIRAALKMPIFGVEFDVHLSRDHVPIVIHQETFVCDRVGQQIVPSKSDSARAWTLELTMMQLSLLDAGRWFSEEFAGVRIPKLRRVFELEWGERVAVMELKHPHYWSNRSDTAWAPLLVDAVTPEIATFIGRGGALLLLSFSDQILALCKERFPTVPLVLAIWTDERGNYDAVVKQIRRLGLRAVALAESMVLEDPRWEREIHGAGAEVYVYEETPDSHEGLKAVSLDSRKRCWEKLLKGGVDAVGTDFPDKIAAFFGSEFSP